MLPSCRVFGLNQQFSNFGFFFVYDPSVKYVLCLDLSQRCRTETKVSQYLPFTMGNECSLIWPILLFLPSYLKIIVNHKLIPQMTVCNLPIEKGENMTFFLQLLGIKQNFEMRHYENSELRGNYIKLRFQVFILIWNFMSRESSLQWPKGQ